jgi:phage/plasmid-associated DNA primase
MRASKSRLQVMGGDYECTYLAGKIHNLLPEVDVGEIMRASRLKSIVHGESVGAHNPFGLTFNVSPIALYVFSFNDWPASPSISTACFDP